MNEQAHRARQRGHRPFRNRRGAAMRLRFRGARPQIRILVTGVPTRGPRPLPSHFDSIGTNERKRWPRRSLAPIVGQAARIPPALAAALLDGVVDRRRDRRSARQSPRWPRSARHPRGWWAWPAPGAARPGAHRAAGAHGHDRPLHGASPTACPLRVARAAGRHPACAANTAAREDGSDPARMLPRAPRRLLGPDGSRSMRRSTFRAAYA